MNDAELSQWHSPSEKPVHVGEYNASSSKYANFKRWWNGKEWSRPYTDGDSEGYKARVRCTLSLFQHIIYWRGLRVKPKGSYE